MEIQIHNLGSAFKRFLNQTDLGESAWEKEIESNCPEVYSNLVWNNENNRDWKIDRENALKNLSPALALKGEICSRFDFFEQEFKEQISRFKNAFPNFHIEIPIFALPTLGKFNGRVGSLGKKDFLLFGIDTIVMQNDPEPILYSHEMFHVYHAQTLGNSKQWGTLAQLSFPLWLEGLLLCGAHFTARSWQNHTYAALICTFNPGCNFSA